MIWTKQREFMGAVANPITNTFNTMDRISDWREYQEQTSPMDRSKKLAIKNRRVRVLRRASMRVCKQASSGPEAAYEAWCKTYEVKREVSNGWRDATPGERTVIWRIQTGQWKHPLPGWNVTVTHKNSRAFYTSIYTGISPNPAPGIVR